MLYKRFMALADRGHTDTQSKYYNPPAHARRALIKTMPQCCRCNGSGRCVNSVCVRNNRTCTNCTPSSSGRCENQPSSPETMQPSITLPPMQDSLLPIDEDEAHDQAEVSQTTTDNLITTESPTTRQPIYNSLSQIFSGVRRTVARSVT